MDSPQWPFADPEETEVVTLDRIVRRESPILLVSHDADDGGWQFVDGDQVFEENGEVVLLGEIVQLDPTVLELAELPIGWHAWRPSLDHPWRIAEGEPPANAADEPDTEAEIRD
ncbi:hypothetical protein [Paludisphaera borealis]|uniref:DUF2185 domain-containing protein n=1 Tax=Paludisphaera borealis TaxID=1387353 RepID=A0A1U7CT58_9BACT|nr:hypothetical protein [Paludisphaera borealis]APW62063.1 hypothetical protein BSF38_03595 [Paludisphaera borealis]